MSSAVEHPQQSDVDVEVPGVVGSGLRVPLITGGTAEYANLDHGASAPCLTAVRDAVDALLPWYASVHRGAGFASQVCTRVYESARDVLRRFVGARRDDSVIFTRNTTDAVNLLAAAVPDGTSVVVFDTEHHAALLSWGSEVRRLGIPASADEAVRALDEALADCPEGPKLAVLTGASNVTGELWPVAELARVARRRGARTLLDAAQLAPHRPVRITELGVDHVVLSGHKLYAPFGAGALIGRADWLDAAPPYLVGGGATRAVPDDGVIDWNTGPERHEAGSPNTVGVHALATACRVWSEHAESIIAHEDALLIRLRAGLRDIPGLRELSLFGPEHARVGVVSLTVQDRDAGQNGDAGQARDPGLLASALSAEHGIGVRDGLFCAHRAVRHLLAGSGAQRALRVSIGLGTTTEHVDRFVDALRGLLLDGPSSRYALVEGGWVPEHDPRGFPAALN